MAPTPVDQLDVQALLAASEPRPEIPWSWYAIAAGGVLILLDRTLAGGSPQVETAVNSFFALVMLAVLVSLMMISAAGIRFIRRQHQQLDQIAELIQLRRYPEASLLVQQILSQPSRNPIVRGQALVYLSVILSRFEKFDDAIVVQETLLNNENEQIDPASSFGLRVSRAMAMLRQDRLFDADRAIIELRRSPGGGESGALALIELYRDVKTGHPAEAIELFEKKKTNLRDQLGHRFGDALGLVARAYDLLDQTDKAQMAVHNATILVPPAELLRRYPELAKLKDRYVPATMPAF